MLFVKDGRSDGSFLVRESNSSSGDFVLSVLHNDQVNHYQIRRHTEDAFFSIGKLPHTYSMSALLFLLF